MFCLKNHAFSLMYGTKNTLERNFFIIYSHSLKPISQSDMTEYLLPGGEERNKHL